MLADDNTPNCPFDELEEGMDELPAPHHGISYRRPVPGIPTLVLAPRFPNVVLNPFGPRLIDTPPFDKLTCTPGSNCILRWNLNPMRYSSISVDCARAHRFHLYGNSHAHKCCFLRSPNTLEYPYPAPLANVPPPKFRLNDSSLPPTPVHHRTCFVTNSLLFERNCLNSNENSLSSRFAPLVVLLVSDELVSPLRTQLARSSLVQTKM